MDTETLFETLESWLEELGAGIYPEELRRMTQERAEGWVDGATSALQAMRTLWVPGPRNPVVR